MKPKSFSATAMHVAELCMSRYKAESIDYSKGMGGTAASLGTSVHGALEMYVKQVYLDHTGSPDLKLLLDMFRLSYMQTFHTSEAVGPDYDDGVVMLKNWFKRDDLGDPNRQVISCEVKTNFPIQTSLGPIPFNYIWDRFDKVGDGVYRVVDYKTNRWGINPDDLRNKLQARAYALAAAIQLKDQHPERIWVEFDMLRHDGPVGIEFSREDNEATWRFMKQMAETIIAQDYDNVRETLNPECNFCVRKTSCTQLLKNITTGGVFAHSDEAARVDLRAQLEYQRKAVGMALEEVDAILLTDARELDVMQFDSPTHELRVGVSSQRAVDADFVEKVIGPVLFRKYGGFKFTIGNIEKLLKGDELTPEQKIELGALIYMKKGEPRIKVSEKSTFDEG